MVRLKRMLLAFLFLGMLSLVPSFAFSSVLPCVAQGAYTPICGLQGPEDIEVLADHRHAIVSELPPDMKHSSQPGLILADLVAHRVEPLAVETAPEQGWGDAACIAPPRSFGSHGIHLSTRADGRLELLVVNHDQRESIEALEIRSTAHGYRALWHGCAIYSKGIFNDVASTGDGGFVAVVMLAATDSARADLLDFMTSGSDTGYLVEWHARGGLKRLPNTAVPMPAGVQLSQDGRYIYYTSWSGKQLRMYDRSKGTVVKVTRLSFDPDNISTQPDGTFLVTGIDNLNDFRTCFLTKPAMCQEASTVAAIHPHTLAAKTVLHLKPGFISGASVAVQINRHYYLGSALGDRILDVRLSPAGHTGKQGENSNQRR